MYILKEVSLTCTQGKHLKKTGKEFRNHMCAKDSGPAISNLQLKCCFSAVINQKHSALV